MPTSDLALVDTNVLPEVELMSLAIAPESLPLIEHSDGVIRVGETRVTLETVVEAFNEGATAEEIAAQYPALQLGDIYATITYYLRHRAEVDAYVQRQGQRADAIRHENFVRADQNGIRERLIARRKAQSA
jgi:uncharacterized protein (DUF433 family)